ncbi:hypothetical protein L1049_009017 [Liquidambar formosana]|uniref:Uncharacterized protein n=1 Tax=Liquidambar formosana TaxID=63359 RepID=A0AAP0SBL1_LIQFO
MSKMSLLGTAIRSNFLSRNSKLNQGFPSLLGDSPRRFSTEPQQPQDSPPDPFLQTPSTGLVYGKLSGINKHTLKTDIVNLLEGCNLTLNDVKVDYNWNYMPMAMMVQFRSRSAFDNAFKLIARKGRLYKLERADRAKWDILTAYDGKTVLLQGIPRNAIPEDIERFLSGCDFDASSIQTITKLILSSLH